MKFKIHRITYLIILAASAFAAGGIAHGSAITDATPQTITLSGTTQYDGWNNLTASANAGYPGFPGSSAWPAPIGSNVSGSGDATLNRVSGAVYPAGEGLYFGGFSSTPNTSGGTLSITDTTPVANLATVVLQLEIGEAWTYDFYNGILPTLSYNGGTQSLAATFSAISVQAYNGTVTMPTGEEPIYINLYTLQWDLSGVTDPITDFTITFTGVQHSQVYAAQLDQSDTMTQVVPEPSTYALLILGTAVLLWRTRRREFARI